MASSRLIVASVGTLDPKKPSENGWPAVCGMEERPFRWGGQRWRLARRLAKDYERLPERGEALTHRSMTRRLGRWLVRA